MTKIQRKEAVKNLGLRLPLALHSALVARAQSDRRSLKDTIVVLLERGLGLRKDG